MGAVPVVINVARSGETFARRNAALKVGMVWVNAGVHDADFDPLASIAPFCPDTRHPNQRQGDIQAGVNG